MARTDETIYIRIPEELKTWLQEQAKVSRRSFTSEVVYRLEQSCKAEEAKYEKQA